MTWGGAFPKSFNMARYNALSAAITGMMFEPLVGPPFLEERGHRHLGRKLGGGRPRIHLQAGSIREVERRQEHHRRGHPVLLRCHHESGSDAHFQGGAFASRPEVIDSLTVKITAKSYWKNFWEVGGLVALPKHIWNDSISTR